MKSLAHSILTLATTVIAASCLSTLSASTLGYWRFEGSNFTSNSIGSGTLSSSGDAPVQYTLPVSGAGSAFPNPIPLTGATNLDGASFNNGGRFLTSESNFGSTIAGGRQLTVEAFFNASTVNGGNGIASLWGSSQRTFFASVTDGVLRAGLVYGSTQSTGSSSLAVTAGTDYYAAYVFTGNASNDVIFYLQDLTNGGSLLSETFSMGGNTSSNFNSVSFAATLGGIGAGNYFNGVLDEIRLSTTALNPSEFLIAPIPEPRIYALLLGAGALGLALWARRSRRVD